MASFVHLDYPSEHPGVVRAERLARLVKSLARGFDSARVSASFLLAAVVAALLVAANEVVETWTDGHLLAAWIVMWTVAFASLALLAAPARKVTLGLGEVFKRLIAHRKQVAEDEKLWLVALTDARVMADISRAMSARATEDVRRYT